MGNTIARIQTVTSEAYTRAQAASMPEMNASTLASELGFSLSEPSEQYNLSSLRQLRDKTNYADESDTDFLVAATLSKFLSESIPLIKEEREINPETLVFLNEIEKKHTKIYEALTKVSEAEITDADKKNKVNIIVSEIKKSTIDDLNKFPYEFQQELRGSVAFFSDVNNISINETNAIQFSIPEEVFNEITDVIKDADGDNLQILTAIQKFQKINSEIIHLREKINNNENLQQKARSHTKKKQYEQENALLKSEYNKKVKDLRDFLKGGETLTDLNNFIKINEILKEVIEGFKNRLNNEKKINEVSFVDVKKIESGLQELEKKIDESIHEGGEWKELKESLDSLGIDKKLAAREAALSYSPSVSEKFFTRIDFNDQFLSDMELIESMNRKANKLRKKKKPSSRLKAQEKEKKAKTTPNRNSGAYQIRQRMQADTLNAMKSRPSRPKKEPFTPHLQASSSEALSPREAALLRSKNKNSIELREHYDRLPQRPPEISTPSSSSGIRYITNTAKSEWAIPTKLDKEGITELSKNWANTSNVKFASVWNAMGYHLEKHGKPGELIEEHTREAMSYADYATEKMEAGAFDIYRIPKLNTDADGYYLPTNEGVKIIFFQKREANS